jgi:hypothetical protein
VSDDYGNIGNDGQKVVHTNMTKYVVPKSRGRRPTYESRALEFRQELVTWKRMPESSRPSLRALARKLNTSHQLLTHYLDGLDEWIYTERIRASKKLAQEQANEIRARASAENRQMTMRESLDTLVVPELLDQIENIRQEAKRGRLNWAHVKILKIWARHFPQAREVLEKYSQSALPRKRFMEIVKGTPRLEGDADVAWVRRIWDECAKYGTDCPSVITEEMVRKWSESR